MFLKPLLLPLSIFAGGIGTLQISVWYENYLLLAGGVLLSVVGVTFAFPDHARRMRASMRVRNSSGSSKRRRRREVPGSGRSP